MNEVPLTGLSGYSVPKEYEIGNVIIKEDGIPDKETLTGFLEEKYYREINPQSIFSDHALILYPSEKIATFNIADKLGYIQQRNTDGNPILGSNGNPEIATDPTSGNQLILHKFPIEQENLKFKEKNPDYRKRVENNINKCFEYLNDGRVSVIALQETLPSVFTTELRSLDRENKYRNIHLQAVGDKPPKDLLFLYNPSQRNLVQTELLLPTRFENTTGMKAPMNTTLTATLKKRILVCKDEAKKELLFNVHIPGLDLEEGPVEERRKNTLKLLLEIKKKYTEKPEFNGYSFLFIGDFNVPLVADTQSTKDVYNTIGYPMEIHTTVGNEGFSYVDNNRTRTPANIDCLVKLPSIGGGAPAAPAAAEPSARRIRFANEEGLPLTTTEPNGSIVSISTENRDGNNEDEDEKEDKVLLANPIATNTSLPTILRIGNGGKFDEFINTAEKTFTSSGGFSILHKGGQKELQELYSVRDADRLAVLQKAFGVKRLSDKPPIMSVLEQGCTPEYDVNAVDQALESRIDTLKAELASMSETTQKGMKTAFLKVLEELLEQVRGLPEDTPCPSPRGSSGPEPGARPEAGPSGCPCLDDLDLLRDLVILVVKLLGVASPRIQEQLDAVKLNEILELLKGGMNPSAAAKLRDVIGALGELEGVEEVASTAEVKPILESIWKVITDEVPIPDNLTLDLVINKLVFIFTEFATLFQKQTEVISNLRIEIAEKVAEVDQLRTEINTLQGGTATAEQLAAVQTELDETRARVAALVAEKETLEKATAEKATVNAGESAAQAEELTIVTRQLAEAIENQRLLGNELSRVQSILNDSEDTKEATLAEITALTAERDAAKAKIAGLATTKTELSARLEEREAEIGALKAEKATLEASMAAGNATIGERFAEINANLAAAQAAKQECEKSITALQSELAAAKEHITQQELTITSLKARAESAEKESAETKAASAAATAQLAELTMRLTAVTEELDALRVSQAEAEAAIAAKKIELDTRATELEGIVPSLKAQLAALTASLETAEKTAAEKIEEAARLTAELTATKETLTRARDEHAREKTASEEQGRKLIAQLTELEGRIRATEDAADRITSTDALKNAELETLRTTKNTLTAELAALKTSGTNQDQAIRELTANYNSKIKECEERLAQLQKEKESELAAQKQEYEEKLTVKNSSIEEIKRQLEEAQRATSAAEEKATGNIAKAQQAANAKVAAAETAAKEKGSENAERLRTLEEALVSEKAKKGELEKNILAAGVPTSVISNPTLKHISDRITALQQRLGKETAEKVALEDKLEELNTLQATIKSKEKIIETQKDALVSLTAVATSQQQQLAEQEQQIATLTKPVNMNEIGRLAKAKATELQATGQASTASIRGQVNVLYSSLEKLQETVQKTIAIDQAPSEETQQRLNTLLSIILVDPELQSAAKEYFVSGNETELTKLSSKQSSSGILSVELCDFYTYLYGIVSLQYKKLPSKFGDDIFSYFKNPPADDTEATKALLKEIALLFQAFFIMGETSTIPADLTLSVDVPILSTFLLGLQVQPLKDEVSRNAFAREVSGLGFLGQLALVPKEGTQKVVLTKIGTNFINEFVKENTKHVLPLAVLAVKLIQLLHKDLNEKYRDIRTKCGTVAEFKPEAAAVAQEGGGLDSEDTIDFEELLL